MSDENPSSNRCLTQEEMDDFLEKEIFNNQSPKRKRDEEMIEPSKRIRCEEINQSPKRKRDEEMIEPSKRIRCEEINQSPKRKRDEEMIEPSKRIRCEEINQSPKRKRDEEMIEPSKRIRCEEIFNNQPMKRKRDKQTQTDYQSNQVCFKVLYQFLNKYNKTIKQHE